MIDYLERLFFSDKREWEGERERENPAPSLHWEEELPRSLAVADVRAEEPHNLAAAKVRSEEPQNLTAAFLREEEPGKMVAAEFREEELPRDPVVLPRGEEESVQELPMATFSEQEREARRILYRMQEREGDWSAPRPKLTGEPGRELARVSAAWEEPVSEAYNSRIPERYGTQAREEELEHRLRRNSRRYDSGFFLY